MTKAECAERGWFNKTDLKAERLKPAPDQRPAAEYWQGQGVVAVYDRALCVPMKTYRAPSEAQLKALEAGRDLVGSHACVTPGCEQRVFTEERSAYCQDCRDRKRITGVINIAREWLDSNPLVLFSVLTASVNY